MTQPQAAPAPAPGPAPAAAAAPSLREARKDFARAHICQAARDLFFRQGYAATTFEQIARAAGTRRTTLYSHFADKAEILAAIGTDYHHQVAQVAGRLPGPRPTRAQIDAWIDDLVGFVRTERTPAMLMIGLGVGHDTPPAVEAASRQFGAALAANIPAFARALDPATGSPQARARARLILRELSLGCLEAARDGAGGEDGRRLLAVVAELFEGFIAMGENAGQ